ncbi:MAG: hypothetical protein V4499_02855 [Pseudomonadota bacterium]
MLVILLWMASWSWLKFAWRQPRLRGECQGQDALVREPMTAK